MKFQFNDGGRAAAGYKGNTGDCVCRAICIVTGLPYQQVYDRLARGNESQRVTKRSKLSKARKRTASHGISVKRKWFRDYMAELGLVWVPTMQIGSGCKVHLIDGELPAGRLIVSVSKHWTAVIDGVIHDTYDPSADRGCTTYPLGYPEDQLPKGAYLLENGNGWGYEPKRCVYGYYYRPGDVFDRHKKEQKELYHELYVEHKIKEIATQLEKFKK